MTCKEEKGEDRKLSRERECLNCFCIEIAMCRPRKLRPVMGKRHRAPFRSYENLMTVAIEVYNS
jgi:hypothetical protein